MQKDDKAPRWWLSGTTCSTQINTINWISDCGGYVLLKHKGHSEWCGVGSGNQYCPTIFALFKSTCKKSDVHGSKNSLAFWPSGKWNKDKQADLEKIIEMEKASNDTITASQGDRAKELNPG